MTDGFRGEIRETMFIVDGGPEARLPEGSGGPVLAGDEALFIAGRVAADASTLVRMEYQGDHGDLVPAYSGILLTPNGVLRLLTASDAQVLVEFDTPDSETPVEVFLTNLYEPDEILVRIGESQDAQVERN